MTTMDPSRRNLSVGRRWPTSWAARHDEWKRRDEAYKGLAYRELDIKALGLWQGTDASGNVVHEARRIMQDAAFVIDTCTAALASSLSLSLKPDVVDRLVVNVAGMEQDDAETARVIAVDQRLELGRAIWERSRVQDRAEEWARMLCALGDIGLQAVNDADRGAMFVAHQPMACEWYYDAHGLDLERVKVEFDYLTADDKGNTETVRYTRWIDAEQTRTRDGADAAEVPYHHNLGVVPFVHVGFKQLGEPEFSAHAAYGVEDGESIVNSVLSQVVAVGSRAASPWFVVLGAAVRGESIDIAAMGKILGLPPDTDFKIVEAALTGLSSLVEGARFARESYMAARPEFMFTESSANASGTALSYRAGEFKMRIEPAQRRFCRALATITGYALAMELGEVYDPSQHDVYEVSSGPALPEDIAARAELIIATRDAGLLLDKDAVHAMQAMGLAPASISAEEYVTRLRSEAGPRHAANVATIAAAMGQRGAADTTDATPPPDAGAEPLNGAQLTAAADVSKDVAAGLLPYDGATALLVEGLKIDAARAVRILGPRTFRPRSQD